MVQEFWPENMGRLQQNGDYVLLTRAGIHGRMVLLCAFLAVAFASTAYPETPPAEEEDLGTPQETPQPTAISDSVAISKPTAAPASPSGPYRLGLFVGADLTFFAVRASFPCTWPAACAPGELVHVKTSASSPGGDLSLGYRLNRFVAVELHGLFCDEKDNTVKDTQRDANAILDEIGAVGASVRADIPLFKRASLFARYGIWRQNADFEYDPPYPGFPAGYKGYQAFDHRLTLSSVGAEWFIFQQVGIHYTYTFSRTISNGPDATMSWRAWSLGLVGRF